MDRLKKEDLEKFRNEKEKELINFDVNNFMDIIYQYNLYEYTNDIYDDNTMKEILKKELDNSGWLRVKNMLSGICEVREDYFCMDAYGNFYNVTNNDINNIIDDIEKNYDFSKNEEYEI